MSDDDAVERRYRELAREEPPPAIDAAILAAARRRGPSRIGRWAGPVSIAAVLMLGIGVSLRMQTEKPGVESAMPSEYAAPASPEYAAPPASQLDAPAVAAPAQAPARQLDVPAAAAEKPAAAAPQRLEKRAAPADPARQLERIAQLRESGAHAEADRLLEEFRRRHPGFRIPEAMWERVRAR